MLAIFINGLSTAAGALLGIFLGKWFEEKWEKALFSAIALVNIGIGIQGGIKTENWLLVLVSMSLGALIGTIVSLEDKMQHVGEVLKEKLHAGNDARFVDGFVTLSVLQIVGAMAILGPIQAALVNDPSLLYLKSVLDFVSAFLFASVYGVGILPVGLVVIVYELLFYFFASVLSPLMTPDVVRELNAVGNLLILAIGLNLLGIVKLKVADYLPAVFIPVIYFTVLAWLS